MLEQSDYYRKFYYGNVEYVITRVWENDNGIKLIRCISPKKLPAGLYFEHECMPEEAWFQEKELKKMLDEKDWELFDD